jgi:phage I-like protein
VAAPASNSTFETEHLGTLQDGRSLVRVLCEVSPNAEGKLPESIQLLPAGPLVNTRDGRKFVVTSLENVIAASSLDLLVDWEHASEVGGSTEAAGWITGLELSDGTMKPAGLWGSVTFTPEGARDVATKAYRFLSPVLLLDPETRDVQQVVSAALTNRPALHMAALDSFRERLSARFGPIAHEPDGVSAMKLETVLALCSALGLPQESEESKILEAVTSATSLREACATLTTELASASERAQAAEAKVAELEKASFAAEIESVLDKAATEGKVTPASAKHWREFCSASRANFAMFQSNVLPALPALGDKAPKSAPVDANALDESDPIVKEALSKGFSTETILAAQKLIKTRAPSEEK